MGEGRESGQRPPMQPREIRAVIEQLSRLIDLVAFQAVIGRKTRFGDRPGPEPWYHTRRLVDTFPGAEKPDVGELVTLFGQAGAANEIEAAEWVALHLKYVK
jgi:hypothetical protein